MSSLETNDACRMCSGNAKKEVHQSFVEVLYFRRYYKHYEFNIDENGYRQKVMKRYINVSVCTDIPYFSANEKIDKALEELESYFRELIDIYTIIKS